MKKISLNGKWNMFLKSAGRRYEANVPCSDYSAMLDEKAIPDPFYATNEKDCLFISESDKTFERSFHLEKTSLIMITSFYPAKCLTRFAKSISTIL